MCGVFGFVSFDGKGPNLKRLVKIARVTMRRGQHAFGFAWLDGAGRLKMFKQTGRIVDYLGLLAMARDARLLVGPGERVHAIDQQRRRTRHPRPLRLLLRRDHLPVDYGGRVARRSRTTGRTPARCNSAASHMPTGPPPTTATS